MDKPTSPVEDAISVVGSLSELADRLGISPQAVWRWRATKSIPLDRVLDVERITGIPREELKPEFFGAPRPRPRKKAAIDYVAA